MKFVDYLQCISDHTLFIKKEEGKITTLIEYVDIIVCTGILPRYWSVKVETGNHSFPEKVCIGFIDRH